MKKFEKIYGIKIIPTDGIVNGYKFALSDKIYISSHNYEAIKGAEPKGICMGLAMLVEINL